MEAELRRALASDASAVLVDLSEVTFIDSTGLRALIAAVQASDQNGHKLAIQRNLSPAVERALEISGLGEGLFFAD